MKERTGWRFRFRRRGDANTAARKPELIAAVVVRKARPSASKAARASNPEMDAQITADPGCHGRVTGGIPPLA
jgi:hypothetical protein